MKFSTNFYLLTIASFRIGVPSILFIIFYYFSAKIGLQTAEKELKQNSSNVMVLFFILFFFFFHLGFAKKLAKGP